MTYRIFIIQLLLVLAASTYGQQGNTTLNTDITLKTDSIEISGLLDTLSSKYNLHFSYNPELIGASRKVKIDVKKKPLYAILQEITIPSVFNFRAFDKQIVFFPTTTAAEETADTLKYIVVRGVVFDERRRETIPYCNIAIEGKALGTMSNNEGRFTFRVSSAYKTDTLRFSSMGYEAAFMPIHEIENNEIEIVLQRKTYQLRQIDVVRYNPQALLEKMHEAKHSNYDNDYVLLTNFYRETTLENNEYTDISEAVLQVMKAPYSDDFRQDHVKFIKGRKGTEQKPHTDIRFRLMGGPYYITKLDVVKNNESFINPEFQHLYSYDFEKLTLIDNRESAVISFKPVYALRDILYEGKLYIDLETFALARVEFEYTRQGLRSARNTLIHKEPRRTRTVPEALDYVVQYKYIDGHWYLLSARSSFHLRIVNRDQRERTRFHSIAEIVTTNIEKGDLQQFSRKEIFRPNEIFTDKIVSYDEEFWKNHNVIQPELRLIDALRNFDNRNLFITYSN